MNNEPLVDVFHLGLNFFEITDLTIHKYKATKKEIIKNTLLSECIFSFGGSGRIFTPHQFFDFGE
jgi:hypothetical protein